MADRRLELHPGAREDYLQTLDWYLDRSDRLARRFQDEFLRILDRIIVDPNLAAADMAGVRWKRMGRFPQVIYYRLQGESTIQVLAVAHGRRRPGYWRDRLL